MNFRNLVIFVTIIGLFLPMSFSTVLKYDDGSKDTAIDLDSSIYAVRFTPQQTGILTKAKFFAKAKNNWFFPFLISSLFIYDDQHSQKPGAGFNATFDTSFNWRTSNFWSFSQSDRTFKKNNDFYIGLKKTAGLGKLGADTSSPDNRSEYYDGSWHSISDRDYMIRAVFNYFPIPSNPVVSPTPTNLPTITLTAQCNDDGRVYGAQYRIDGGSWHNMSASDGSWGSSTENVISNINISSLSEGQHTLEVRCKDKAGNYTDVDDYESTTFFKDTVPPVSSLSFSGTMGNNNYYVSDVDVTLSATDPSPSSGVKYVRYQLTGATTFPATNFSGSSTNFTLSNDGATTITYRSQDNAGNWESSNNTTIQIDQTPPTAPTLNSFSSEYISTSTTTINWTASSDATSGVDYYVLERKVDNGSWQVLASNIIGLSYTDNTLTSDHKYEYRVKAVDRAGNESSYSNTEHVILDDIKPSTPVLDSLPWTTNNADVDLSWTQSQDNGTFPSGVAYYNLNENGTTTYGITATTYTDSGNAEGQHNYQVQAEDFSNPPNTSDWSNQVSTLVDLTPPTTNLTISPNSPDGLNDWYITNPQITLTADDGPGSGVKEITYCIDTVAGCTPNITVAGQTTTFTLNEGKYYISYYAEDNAGNKEATKTSALIKVDITAPYNQSILLDNGNTYNTTGDVMATPLNPGTDDTSGLDYCEISWDNGNTWQNVGLSASAGPHHFPDGFPIVQYRCYDKAGNVSNPVMDDIIVDTTPPTSEVEYPLAMSEYIKGKMIIEGSAQDATSGVDYVEIKIERRKTTDNGWEVVLPWTQVNGTTSWTYEWNNSDKKTGLYRVISRAQDKAGWIETPAEQHKIRFFTTENQSPDFENIYFKNNGDRYVALYGYLDRINTDYTIEIFDLEQGLSSTALYSYTTTTDENAYFFTSLDVSSWDVDKLYAARIVLADGTILYSQFDTLAAANIIDELTFINQEISDLWDADADQQTQIDSLQNRVDQLEVDLMSLADELDNFETYVDTQLTLLQNQIDAIKDTLTAINHTTINLSYASNTKTLTVSGEAADGCTNIQITLVSTDGLITYGPYTTTPDSDNKYSYAIDVSSFDKTKAYNVLVSSDGYTIDGTNVHLAKAIFNNLLLEHHQELIEELDEKVDALDTGTVSFVYDSTNSQITVSGESPFDAKCAKVYLASPTGTYLAEKTAQITEDASQYDYSASFDISSFPKEPINAYISFYSTTDCSGVPFQTISDSSSVLLAKETFGFKDIHIATTITDYYFQSVTPPISFAFKPSQTGQYRLTYSIDGIVLPGVEFVGCTNFNEGQTYTYQSNIELYSTGVHTLKLIAEPCSNGLPTFYSNPIRILVRDLKDNYTASTTIISPVITSSNWAYPVGSKFNDVFWTKSGSVNLVSVLTTNTEEETPRCEITYIDSDNAETLIKYYPSTQIGNGVYQCTPYAQNFNTSLWRNTNQNPEGYTTIKITNEVVAQPDAQAEIKIGIDNTPPTISSIVPDEHGIMNGIYTWYATIHDNLSGVNKVTFYLIEKDGEQYCQNGVCHEGTEGTIVWQSTNVSYDSVNDRFSYDLDTTAHPDGHYNVAFEATDIAGNTAYLQVDPIIDNTAPESSETELLIESPKTQPILKVKTKLSDNLTGISEAYLLITIPDSEPIKVDLNKEGDYYIAEYQLPQNFPLPQGYNYLITIIAKDGAGNSLSNSYLLDYAYFLELSLSKNPVYYDEQFQINANLIKDNNQNMDANLDLQWEEWQGINKIWKSEIKEVINGAMVPKTMSYSIVDDYKIKAKVKAPNNFTFIDETTISVIKKSTTSTSSSGGGGGGGGSSITKPKEEEEQEEQTEETETEEEQTETPPAQKEEPAQNTQPPANNQPQSTPQPTPQSTGFFGLGLDNSMIGAGAAILVIIGAGAYFFFFGRKF